MSVAQSYFFSLHLFNFCVVSNTAQTCQREHFVCQLRGSPPSILSPKFHLHYGFYYTVTMTSRHNNSCVTLLLCCWLECCAVVVRSISRCSYHESLSFRVCGWCCCMAASQRAISDPIINRRTRPIPTMRPDADIDAGNWIGKKYHTTLSFPLFQLELLSLARFSHKFHRNGTEHHLLTRPNFFLILFFTTLF